MKRIRYSLLMGLLAASHAGAAISLSNVSASQREGSKSVDISFDAFNTEGSTLSVSVIISNATAQVSQFTSNSIPEGTGRLVTWNGETDLNGIITSNLSVTVSVSGAAPGDFSLIPAGINAGADPDYNYYSHLANALWMGTTEVRFSEWENVRGWAVNNGYTFSQSGSKKASNHPVVNIDWYDCIIWCNARSEMEGLDPVYTNGFINQPVNVYFPGMPVLSAAATADGYRLPTQEEWEYAARGGQVGLRFPWGDEILHTNANYISNETYDYDISETPGFHPAYNTSPDPKTAPADSFEPNAYGLFGMSGNVLEWCWDVIGSGRSRKGGSWNSEAPYLRIGHRDFSGVDPQVNNMAIGFRVVRNAPGGTQQNVTTVFDSRDYQLAVSSERGSPVPMVGTNTYAWMTKLTCDVEAAVTVSGTNYTCIGWYGSGSIPVSGPFNGVTVTLSNLVSGITWNWVTDDSDSDGMNDDWERDYFGDLSQAATNDFDLDGQDNFSEYIAGTIPTNPASRFALVPGVAGVDSIKVEWPPAQGRTYNVYWTPNLLYTDFQPLETNIAYPRNSVTVTPTRLQGFYKVDVSK